MVNTEERKRIYSNYTGRPAYKQQFGQENKILQAGFETRQECRQKVHVKQMFSMLFSLYFSKIGNTGGQGEDRRK